MNKKLKRRVAFIKKRYAQSELKRLFTGRKRQILFASVGRLSAPHVKNFVELVWLGFEILTNSVYRAGHAAW